MRIACLQFAPQVGETASNLEIADELLRRCKPGDFDLLVLPEMAFTGMYWNTWPAYMIRSMLIR